MLSRNARCVRSTSAIRSSICFASNCQQLNAARSTLRAPLERHHGVVRLTLENLPHAPRPRIERHALFPEVLEPVIDARDAAIDVTQHARHDESLGSTSRHAGGARPPEVARLEIIQAHDVGYAEAQPARTAAVQHVGREFLGVLVLYRL